MMIAEMSEFKRIAVIGAGASGLAAIKSCLEEKMKVICYERTDNYGGLWRFRKEDVEGAASVMKTTMSNVSKEMSAFSDFPPPTDFPVFLSHKKVMEYFGKYAETFDLLRHVRFSVEVISIRPYTDFESNGRWVVIIRHLEEDVVTEDVFDGVMVCTGRHAYPNLPTLRDQNKFLGRMLHTKSLRECDGYEGKKVLIVGFGNSAVDCAAEISTLAEQVYISTRRGSWIFPRLAHKNTPFDMTFLRRHFNFYKSTTFSGACSYLEKVLNRRVNHAMYNIKPEHRVLNQYPTVTDILPDKILSGRVIIKGDIQKFDENGVVFEGESHITELDEVIFATGYQVKFPFLPKGLISDENGELNLYKYVFPVGIEHPTLAIIGLAQPLGPIIPVSESQCRWVSQVFSHGLELPDEKAMKKDIDFRKRLTARRFARSSRHFLPVDWIEYMDDLAREYGAKPSLPNLLLKDPALFWSCLTGPCLPYQYRLEGPHTWAGARDAILKCHERVTVSLLPTKPNKNSEFKSKSSYPQMFYSS